MLSKSLWSPETLPLVVESSVVAGLPVTIGVEIVVLVVLAVVVVLLGATTSYVLKKCLKSQCQTEFPLTLCHFS